MDIEIRKYKDEDIPQMIKIWNEVVKDGAAFPQEEFLTAETGKAFFEEQSICSVAVSSDNNLICGLYILHPNNIGRCGHICNASYAVSSGFRGFHIGERLVSDSITQGKVLGFRILQFNAVVASNTAAKRLYEKLGFVSLGIIPQGFRMRDGLYEDICPYYKTL